MNLEYTNKIAKGLFLVVFFCFGCLIVTGCDTTDESVETANSNGQSVVDMVSEQGYPYPGVTADTNGNAGYPEPNIYEGLSQSPPDPELDLPLAEESAGVVGGVLIREVLDQGYEPLVPVSLSLAEVVYTTDGQPAFIRSNNESIKAELYPTGIFIFSNVVPGEYGLMVDIGYTQFPIKGDDGWPILVTVEPGQAIDLGQVVTELPNS